MTKLSNTKASDIIKEHYSSQPDSSFARFSIDLIETVEFALGGQPTASEVKSIIIDRNKLAKLSTNTNSDSIKSKIESLLDMDSEFYDRMIAEPRVALSQNPPIVKRISRACL